MLHSDNVLPVSHLLLRQAEERGDAPFIVGKDGRSFAEAWSESARVANVLAGCGIKRGETVAIVSRNRSEFVFTWVAACTVGAIQVPINPTLRGAALAYQLNDCRASVLVVEAEKVADVNAVSDDLVHLKQLIVIGDTQANSQWSIIPYLEAMGSASERSIDSLDVDSGTSLLYTSGTTGPAKGVLGSHRYVWHWGRNYVDHMSVREDDLNYLFGPLHHAMSQFLGVVPALMTGSSITINKPFSASRFWDYCRNEGVTLFNFTGSVLSFLWKQEPRDDDADNPVERALGVPIPGYLYPQFEKRFGMTLLPSYGSTESGMVCFSAPGLVRKGSSGRPHSKVELRIVGDDGSDRPSGEVGEIAVRWKSRGALMSGYFGRDDATRKAVRDGWYYSGDIGRVDKEGYLFFIDRKNDRIRRRGENISSFDIERVVENHPSVSECAAVGVASEHGEEEIKIDVVLKQGREMTPTELWEYCDGQLSPFMVPRYLHFREMLPRTQTGKVEKHLLRADGLAEGVVDRAAAARNH